MRTWFVAVGVLVVGGGIVAWAAFRNDQPDYEIISAVTQSGPIRMTIETSGTVEPLSTVQVGCEVTGKIKELAVDDDQSVSEGQVIALIDPELAEAEHRQSRADHVKAQLALVSAELALEEQEAKLPILTTQALANREDAEAALKDAEFQWNRVQQFYKQGDASEAEKVVREAVYLRAKAAVMAARAAHDLAVKNEDFLSRHAQQAVEQARATLELAEARQTFTQTRVERCTINSPIDGIVLKRYLDVGTTVVATFQPPLLYLLAPSLDRMRVSAKVSESDIAHIDIGQPASFVVEARQPVRFSGRILAKHNQPDIVQNVVTYTVVFEVDNDARRTLIPGLTVNVEIECVAKEAVPYVENAVLRFKPPLQTEERRALLDAATWPDRPVTDAEGNSPPYCSKAHAWQYDETARRWTAVPLWVGITDNLNTEILAGAKPGTSFVKKFIDKTESGFGFKDALRLASPSNRTL